MAIRAQTIGVMLYEINDNFDVCAVNFDTIKLILYVIVSKALISQGFLDIEKERKLQYRWYHNFRSYVVEVRRLELRASWSQRNPEYLFPLISRRFRPFPLGNTSFPALLSPLFPCAPCVDVG